MYNIVYESMLDKTECKIYHNWEHKPPMTCSMLTCDVEIPKQITSFGILDCTKFYKDDVVEYLY